MWVFLSDAFLSIVEDREDPTGSSLLVRARAREDIRRVFPEARVSESPARDYRFRASLSRERVAEVMAAFVRGIGYGNFKDSVAEGDRAQAYLRVWSSMYAFQGARLLPPVRKKRGRPH